MFGLLRRSGRTLDYRQDVQQSNQKDRTDVTVDYDASGYEDLADAAHRAKQLESSEQILAFKSQLCQIYTSEEEAIQIYRRIINQDALRLDLTDGECIDDFISDISRINELLTDVNIGVEVKQISISQLLCFPSVVTYQKAHLNTHRAILTLRAEKAKTLPALQSVKMQLLSNFVEKFKQECSGVSGRTESILKNKLCRALGLPQSTIEAARNQNDNVPRE